MRNIPFTRRPNTRVTAIAWIVTAFALVASACSEPTATPQEVASALIAAYNVGDSEAAIALMSDDVQYEEPGIFANKAEVAAWIEWVAAWQQHITIDQCTESTQGDSTVVDCIGSWENVLTKAHNLDPCPATYTLTVMDGIIVEATEGTDCNYYDAIWTPFQTWVEQNHPDDVPQMFSYANDGDNKNHSAVLDTESTELWTRHLAEHAAEVTKTSNPTDATTSTTSLASTSSTATTTTVAETANSLTEIVQSRYNGGTGAVIIGVFDAAGSSVAAAGLDGDGRPVTADRPWTTASLAKVFTAVAVMQLVENGQIDLDAPVARYVDFPVPEQISVRHLLEHKSAIPSMFSHINDCTDESTLDEIKEVAGRVPVGVPGETIKYSNTNYLILGLLIESVTGQDPGGHMSEHLFTPLHMGDTYWFESQNGPAPWWPRPEVGQGVGLFDCGVLGNTIGTDGAAVTTIKDMDLFYSGLFSEAVITNETLNTMLDMNSGVFGFRYGLGLLEMVNESYPTDLLYGFGGDGLFYRTAAFHDPDKDRTVAVFTSIGDQQPLLWRAIEWANKQP